MAASVRVPVNASIWDWVTRIGSLKGLSPDDQRNIERWRAGETDPTVNQLSQFSRKLRIPFGYFFLNEPIEDTPAVFAHRTIANAAIVKPSRDLIDTISDMQAIQDWVRQDALETGLERLPFVGSCPVGRVTVAMLAQKIRQVLGLSLKWFVKNGRSLSAEDAFATLRGCCDNAGVVVMLNGIVGDNTHRPLDAQEFRAFALIDEYAPLIFINRTDSRRGQLFSLAHEIAHIWVGAEEIYNDTYHYASNAPVEVLCNAVAAELLIPRSLFNERWQDAVRNCIDAPDAVEVLAREFPVSQVVIARRALDGMMISEQEYQSIVDKSRRHWDVQKTSGGSGGNYYNTKQSRLDHRFLERLAASVSEGRTSYEEAYRLTGSNRKTFPKILDSMGERGR